MDETIISSGHFEINWPLDQTAAKFNLIIVPGDGCRQKTLPQRLCQVLPVSHEFDSCLPEQSWRSTFLLCLLRENFQPIRIHLRWLHRHYNSRRYRKVRKILRATSTFKVEMFLEQREVAFLSPSKICKNLNFSTVHL